MKNRFKFDIPALRVLENEHQFLTYLMNGWHPLALQVVENNEMSETEARHSFSLLRKKLVEFIDPLKNHTDKEENHVFSALIKYVGNEQGPVVAIEEEHEEIDAYIGHFLYHSRVNQLNLTREDMRAIANDACEAYEVITFHFIKEESIIFPMVQLILQPKEQYDMLENVYDSII